MAAGQVQLEPRDKRHLPAGWSPAALAQGDVDGDGDADLVVRNVGQLELHLNDGTGIFHRSPGLTTGLFNPCSVQYSSLHVLLLADVDNDRDLDVLFVTCQPLLYLNDGRGRFSDASHQLPSDVRGVIAACAGDIDGDGDVDVITGASSNWPGTVLVNDGNGWFAIAPDRLPNVSGYMLTVALFDVDGDVDLDLFEGDARVYGQSRLYLNDGSGAFKDASSRCLPGTYAATSSAAVIDLTVDGRVDLLLTCAGKPVLLVNTPGGVLVDETAQRLPPWTAGNAYRVFTGDVELDGDVDVIIEVVASPQDIGQRLFLNDGTGRFVDGTAGRLQPGLDGLLVADVDGDRDLDVFCPGLSLNDGRGVFQPAQPSPIPWKDVGTDVAVADIDGNGSLDIVATGGVSSTACLDVFLNLGHGCFVRPAALPSPMPMSSTESPQLVDLDGDGRRDLLFSAANAGLRVYVNAGAGSFVDLSQKLLPVVVPHGSITPIDADGDGDADLLGGSGAFDRLLLNDGTGRLQDVSATHLPSYSLGGTAHLVADFDGDGDADVVVANGPARFLWFYDNGGRGVFSLATDRLPQSPLALGRVMAADVDRDGDVDLVLERAGKILLYANDGRARFTDATAGRVPNDVTSVDFVLADFDLDGDLDLVPETTAAPRLWLNRGFGIYTSVLGRVATFTHPQAVADLDGDGDPDLLAGRRILWNAQRQLVAPYAARLGRAYELEVLARPGYATGQPFALPLFAAGRSRLTIAPYGQLGLDPFTLVAGLPAPVPVPAGVLRLGLAVPNLPALAGRDLVSQTLVLDDPFTASTWRLSNAVADRILR